MNNSTKIKALKSLQKVRDTLNNQIYAAAKEIFPVGTTVCFNKGGGVIRAEILDHAGNGNRPRFKIKSHTGKEYWISLYDLIGD